MIDDLKKGKPPAVLDRRSVFGQDFGNHREEVFI